MIAADEVEKWLGENLTTDDKEVMDTVVKAVIATVTKWHGEPKTWNDRIKTGAIMLAAHLWRRRSSGGNALSAFNTDGAGYIARHDPQAAMLLGLGGWGNVVIA